MKVIEFDLQAWGTRLKNERERTNAKIELWVAPMSYSRASDSSYVPTTFEEISPTTGWVQVTESVHFEGEGRLISSSITDYMVAYSSPKPHFCFKVPDDYDKFAVVVVDCNFCKNLGKTTLMSGSLYRNDPMTQRQSYPFNVPNWMSD